MINHTYLPCWSSCFHFDLLIKKFLGYWFLQLFLFFEGLNLILLLKILSFLSLYIDLYVYYDSVWRRKANIFHSLILLQHILSKSLIFFNSLTLRQIIFLVVFLEIFCSLTFWFLLTVNCYLIMIIYVSTKMFFLLFNFKLTHIVFK